METVCEEIIKENTKKDAMKMLDSISAVEKTATLDFWIGCLAYSMKISRWIKTLYPCLEIP